MEAGLMITEKLLIRSVSLYDNYGHTPGSTLWIWKEDKIEETPAGVGVYHYKIWGDFAVQALYRGRHDLRQNLVSVMPPVGEIGSGCGVLPAGLGEGLAQRFPRVPIVVFGGRGVEEG